MTGGPARGGRGFPLGQAIVSIAVVIGLPALFFSCFERRSEEIDGPPSYEARRNRFLAAERLLERSGAQVRIFADPAALPWPPPRAATLIVPGARRTLGAQRSAQMLAWVREGGHLIVTRSPLHARSGRDGEAPDPILAPLGLETPPRGRSVLAPYPDPRGLETGGEAEGESDADPLVREPDLAPDTIEASASASASAEDLEEEDEAFEVVEEWEQETEGPSGEGEEPSDEVRLRDRVGVQATFPDRAEPLEVEFDPASFLRDPDRVADWTIARGDAVHLARVPWGAGRVTALSDARFLASGRIGDRDHAELLYRIAMPGPDTVVWVVIGDDWPSPWELVRRHAGMIVTSLAVLVLAWLLAVSRRLGPLIPDRSAERRSLMEHIEASGRFLWQRGGRIELLGAERRALLDRVRQRHPGWVRLGAVELHAVLAERAGMQPDEVARALDDHREPGPERFEEDVRALDRLSRAI